MTLSTSGRPTWQLIGGSAQLRFREWAATVDLADPGTGLSFTDGWPFPPDKLAILGAGASSPEEIGGLVDSYIRDADLVARYSAADKSPLLVEVCWRATARAWRNIDALQLELLVSVQTDHLGVRAQIGSQSRIPAVHVWLSTDNTWRAPEPAVLGVERPAVALVPGRHVPCVVSELALTGVGEDSSHRGRRFYVEAVSPADFLGSELCREGSRYRLRHLLLDELMEKGVIRRLRVSGWLMADDHPFVVAATGLQELAGDELPLIA